MKKVKIVSQGVVLSRPEHVFGYNAWPTVALDDAGAILAACSGYRIMHVCPFGKVLVLRSWNEGKNWSSPVIAIDTPLDDRDAGLVNLGGGRLVLSTFNNSIGQQRVWAAERKSRGFGFKTDRLADLAAAYLPNVSEEAEQKYLGSLLSISQDHGLSWSEPTKVPVTAPHGPNVLRNGSLIYAGTPFPSSPEQSPFPIHVYLSGNCRDFHKLAEIPVCPEEPDALYSEPHIIELPSGRLILQIRMDDRRRPYEERLFSICQSISDDGGMHWREPVLTGAAGAPPHLLLHSSGTLISAYGHRKKEYGIQAMFSQDEGESWDIDHYLWDEGIDSDLGYPSSVELPGGDIFTVFYATLRGENQCSILWVRWQMNLR